MFKETKIQMYRPRMRTSDFSFQKWPLDQLRNALIIESVWTERKFAIFYSKTN